MRKVSGLAGNFKRPELGMSKLRARSQRSNAGRLETRREHVAQAIGSWARDKMHHRDSLIPKPEELKLLLTDSKAISMWDHVTTCIDSPSKIDIAKKNLQLSLGDILNEGTECVAKRLELSRELNSLQLAVSHMETDISRLQADIGTLADANRVTECEVSEITRKATMLSAHSIKSRETKGLMEEFSSQLSRRKELFCFSDKEPSYFTRPGGVADVTTTGGSRSVVVESACKREMRNTVESVRDLLESLSARNGESSTEDERTRAQVWSKVEGLLSGYPPVVLMKNLCELARDEAVVIHSNTTSLNLSADAARLRYRLDQSVGKNQVESSLLQSVEDHLMEAQLAHIKRCVECERSQNAAKTAQERLEEMKGQIEQLLWRQLPSVEDHTKRELVRASLFQQFEESGCEAMLESLSSLCAGLNSAKSQRREALDTLQVKKEHINQFAQLTEGKDSLIRSLVKMNSAGRGRLQRQRSELEVYIKRKLCGHEAELLTLGARLLKSGQTELELFSLLSLQRTLRTPGLNIPTCELSIYRLHADQPSGYPRWKELLATLGLPQHTSPHALFTHVVSSLDRINSLYQETDYQKELIGKMKECVIADSKDLLQASSDYDDHLQNKGVEEISKNLLLASKGLAECSNVQHALQEWWEEPSQLSVPWVKYEEMSLTEWLKQWRVLTAKLRLLSNT